MVDRGAVRVIFRDAHEEDARRDLGDVLRLRRLDVADRVGEFHVGDDLPLRHREDAEIIAVLKTERLQEDKIARDADILKVHRAVRLHRPEVRVLGKRRVIETEIVSAIYICQNHKLIGLLDVGDSEHIPAVRNMNRVHLLKRIRIHDKQNAAVRRREIAVRSDIDQLCTRIVGHAVAVLPVRVCDALREAVLRDRIAICVRRVLVVGGHSVRFRAAAGRIFDRDDIIFRRAHRLDDALCALKRIRKDLRPGNIVECVRICHRSVRIKRSPEHTQHHKSCRCKSF